MNILVTSQYYPPEIAAGGVRISEMARHWVRAGHKVTVLTGFPNYPNGVLHPAYRSGPRLALHEVLDGVNVYRTFLSTRPNGSKSDRILNYGTFCISAAMAGVSLARPDMVVATSPPLTVGLAGWCISRRFRVPLVLDLRDLWPESLTALEGGSARSASYRTVGRLAAFLYQKCSRLVVVSPAFQQRLMRDWNVPSQKLSLVENGVEEELFAFGSADGNLRTQLGLSEKFAVGYFGTLGLAHGLDTLLQAAAILRLSCPRVMILLAGGGGESGRLAAQIQQRNLTNVRMLGLQMRGNIPDFIRACDACLVLLKRSEVFTTVIPTKLLEAMSCGRAVILGVDGQARDIVERAQSGIFVDPENSVALAKGILTLHDNPELCSRFGANGRACVTQQFSRKDKAQQYLRLLQACLTTSAIDASEGGVGDAVAAERLSGALQTGTTGQQTSAAAGGEHAA